MKRNVFTLVLSLTLVAVLAVGATFAFLSASDTEVVNTFNFGGMTVKLTETGDGTANTGKGYDYTKLTDGQTLAKAPKVELTTDVDAVLFVKISGLSTGAETAEGAYIYCEGLKTLMQTKGWAAAADVDAAGNGTYYRLVTAIETDPDFTGVLFEQVKTLANLSDGATATVPDVVIRVFAIQQEGYVAGGVPTAEALAAAATSMG